MILQHLFSRWGEISQQVEDASVILLFADYDGTLTPIVEKPDLAKISDDMRQLLEALASQSRIHLAIVSGRALADLRGKVGVGNIIYVGNHGLEIEGCGISFINPVAEELRPIIHNIHYVLSQALEPIKGVLVEDKGLSLSVHFRQVTESKVEMVRKTFEYVVNSVQASSKIRVTTGKKIYEVRPAVDWDKGKAIKFLMEWCIKTDSKNRLLPIYLGDDLTDEDAFKVIANYRSGISVFVGERHDTAARYFLESSAEVTKFLNLLLDWSKGASGER
jgi:trehalose-phosphatase